MLLCGASAPRGTVKCFAEARERVYELACCPLKSIMSHAFLFLDVDGVLNSQASRNQRREQGMDMLEASLPTSEHLASLRRLVSSVPNCAVVLSTSWRLIEEDRRLLDSALATVDIAAIGATRDLCGKGDFATRVDEIHDWLESSNMSCDCAWLALDDVDLTVGVSPERMNEAHFVRTDDAVGLTPANVDDAIEKLRLLQSQVATVRAGKDET